MNNFFSKKRIFIKFMLVIVALFAFDILILVVFGKTSAGVVIRYEIHHAGGASYPSSEYPVIQYDINGHPHQFNGNMNADYYVGDTVQIVYRPWWPRKARINTFWGIARRPMIQCIISLIVWYMVYSSFKVPARKF